jgi:hypothetical protein
MPAINFELATEADDAGLRQLLRNNPMTGAIALTFEREPNFFRAAGIEGDFHQTLVARARVRGEPVALVTRSIRRLFVNGQVQTIGYLSQVRVAPAYARGLFLARGVRHAFDLCHTLHADGRTPFYLTSIVEDNLPAHRLFTAGLSGFPRFHKYARLLTFLIGAGRRPRAGRLPRGIRLERGSPERLGDILGCLQRNGAHYQFAPYWDAENLFTTDQTPNLTPDNFILAISGNRVVACVAGWDQNGFKQTVIRGYHGRLARWRGVINLVASAGGWPAFPPPQTPMHYLYGSHLAVDENDPEIFRALLSALVQHAHDRRYGYVVLGLSDSHPLRASLTKGYRCASYASQIYLVYWEDGAQAASQIDARTPGLEVAVL